jgi:hypothetical protein
MSAIHAFSHDVTASGKPLPDTVSLHELVNGGYISAADAGEADPQAILMRARLPDGSVSALMADGSVQGLPR